MNDIELCIMSCLLVKPDLMKKIRVEDKHFQKHKRMWQFMKSFYEKFGTFDIQLMYSVCKDKWHIVEYMQLLVETEGLYYNFEKYQDRLIEEYAESKKEKYIIENVYQKSLDLLNRLITTDEFKKEIEDIYSRAEKIYGGKEWK